MRRFMRATFVIVSAAAILTAVGLTALAQSGSKTDPAKPGTKAIPPAETTQRVPQQLPVALEGYCPVCILELDKWVMGIADHTAVYDGRTYRFPGEKQEKMFLANPTKYIPVLGGDCVVSFAKMGKRVPGSVRHSTRFQNRLFLFANEQAKKMFEADPGTYANADLAFAGNCPVCLVEMKHRTPGKPEFTVYYEGLRYLFPAAKMRDMFLANPEKYKALAPVEKPPAEGSESR